MKSKDQKRAEAEARRVARALRTPEQQLARLAAHGWLAQRERTRLVAVIQARGKAA